MKTIEAIEFVENMLKSKRFVWGNYDYDSLKNIITLLKRGEAYEKKAKRIERIIADYSIWLKTYHKSMKIKDAAIYWKKLIEDYVFEGVRKVIEILGKKEVIK